MDDKPKDWVDFAAAKAVRFEAVLEALDLMARLRCDGEQLQGICPLHKAAGDKESFGVHLGKQTFNCFACKKHGKVLDFVILYKGIAAKEAAMWLLSLVDNREGSESVHSAAEESSDRTEAKSATSAAAAVEGNGACVMVQPEPKGLQQVREVAREMEQLTERERLLVAVMTRSVSAVLGNIFAGFGEMANPLRIERMLEAHIMEQVKAAFDAKEVARRGWEEEGFEY